MYFEHRLLYIIWQKSNLGKYVSPCPGRDCSWHGIWVKLNACGNFSATTRLVSYMCPDRRCDTSMKLFSSVQYRDLINVYITFFLCGIYNKYEPDTERQRQRQRERERAM